jgi:hypothetical protein
MSRKQRREIRSVGRPAPGGGEADPRRETEAGSGCRGGRDRSVRSPHRSRPTRTLPPIEAARRTRPAIVPIVQKHSGRRRNHACGGADRCLIGRRRSRRRVGSHLARDHERRTNTTSFWQSARRRTPLRTRARGASNTPQLHGAVVPRSRFGKQRPASSTPHETHNSF